MSNVVRVGPNIGLWLALTKPYKTRRRLLSKLYVSCAEKDSRRSIHCIDYGFRRQMYKLRYEYIYMNILTNVLYPLQPLVGPLRRTTETLTRTQNSLLGFWVTRWVWDSRTRKSLLCHCLNKGLSRRRSEERAYNQLHCELIRQLFYLCTVGRSTNAESRAAPNFLRVWHDTLDILHNWARAFDGPLYANESIFAEIVRAGDF